jgi:hypothetical protein
MKLNYNKKGLQIIAVAFIISTIINSIIEKDYSINIIFLEFLPVEPLDYNGAPFIALTNLFLY